MPVAPKTCGQELCWRLSAGDAICPAYATSAVIGSVADINGDFIVGYADQNAITWERTSALWSPRILNHRDGDAFGFANTVSEHGIAGGPYARMVAAANSSSVESESSKEIGILWKRDGTILREFDFDEDRSVRYVIDFLAAIDTVEGTKIYDPRSDTPTDLRQFLRDVAGMDVPQQPLHLVDLEWSSDREKLLFLFEIVDANESSTSNQFIALVDALTPLELDACPLTNSLAAISVGIIDGQPLLDLDYSEDSRAEVDLNVVMTGGQRFIEVQGTAEGEPFLRELLDQQLDLAQVGIQRLTTLQQECLGPDWPQFQ